MKTQTKIITYLIAILMLLQPLMVTVAYATEAGETEIEVVENTELVPITISDEALYEALKKQLGNKASYIDLKNTIEIYREDLNSIKELNLANKKISNLSGIEEFQGLEKLNLTGNNLRKDSNLDILLELPNLNEVNLSSNKIEEISSSLLNSNLSLDFTGQNIKVVEFINRIATTEDPEIADDIIINDKRTEIKLPSILFAYDNAEVNITKVIANGKEVENDELSNYLKMEPDENGVQRIKLLKENLEWEIILEVEENSSNSSNNVTTCIIKAFVIDEETEKGIDFNDENLYKAIKEQYETNQKTSDKDIATVWPKFKLKEWRFPINELIIIANREDLAEINELDVTNKKIKDLTGIQEFVGISNLKLSDNLIIDVSKIKELNANKAAVTAEFIKKHATYLGELDKLLADGTNENGETVKGFNSLKAEIEKKEVDIETARLKIAKGETFEGNIDKMENELDKLEDDLNNRVLPEIKKVIAKIEGLCKEEKDKGIKVLLTGPSLIKAIDEIKETAEFATTLEEQKDVIYINNKLEYVADEINKLLTDLTRAEMTALKDVKLVRYERDNTGVKEIETDIITDERIAELEIEYALKHINTEIDLKEIITSALISEINGLAKAQISLTDKENKEKSVETLKTEIKNALQKFRDLKNNKLKASDLINYCETKQIVTKEELLIEAQNDIINEIKNNIKEYANTQSKIIKNCFEADSLELQHDSDRDNKKQKANSAIIKNLLMPAFEEMSGILTVLSGALKNKAYLNETNDLLRIINRLKSVSDADKTELIKVEDLVKVELNGNNINNVDILSEIATLEELDLSENLIDKFDFSKFSNLKKLSLAGNNISIVEITEMPKIEELDLSYNKTLEDISKINFSGMPKLNKLNLRGNAIKDIEHLIKSKNKYIESLGYKNLGEYWSAGNSKISVAEQLIDITLKITNTTADKVTIELPKIFSQMKELESNDLDVDYGAVVPCLRVYKDGTQAELDTREKNVQQHAIVYMYTGNKIEFPINLENLEIVTCRINYTVVEDEVEPTVTSVTGVSTEWTNGDVTLTIEGATDEGAGLATRPYSFDGGTTWQVSNTKTFTENTDNIVIKVRDAEENIYTHETISIKNIDKTAPVINEPVLEEKTKITISITENESGLKEDNKYYLSTSITEEQDVEWLTYVPNEAFEISKEIAGTYYLHIKPVSDKAGNITTIEPKEFYFDSKDPTITGVSGMPTEETTENVTLTIEGAIDNVALDEHPYSFDGGESWQKSPSKTYTENTKDIQILVRDTNGNVYTHAKLEISQIKKAEEDTTNKPLTFLSFEGITAIISAYINNDFSNLSEDILMVAGEDKVFSFDEVVNLISLYMSNV